MYKLFITSKFKSIICVHFIVSFMAAIVERRKRYEMKREGKKNKGKQVNFFVFDKQGMSSPVQSTL